MEQHIITTNVEKSRLEDFLVEAFFGRTERIKPCEHQIEGFGLFPRRSLSMAEIKDQLTKWFIDHYPNFENKDQQETGRDNVLVYHFYNDGNPRLIRLEAGYFENESQRLLITLKDFPFGI